jgi:hypothetical protein
MSEINKLRYIIFPKWLLVVARYIKVLEFDYNHFQSAYQNRCIDRDGLAIPWYTYPAIEYLKQLDFSDKIVFEYGGGNSTFFWGSRAGKAICVEDNLDWAKYIESRKMGNVQVKYIPDKSEYVAEISRHVGGFDIIVIDGSHSRCKCAQIAITKLNPGGIIILDNSDHYFKSARILRDADLIQVDMTGFGPIQGCTWTTSIFFHRAFNTQPKNNRQPQLGIGSSPSSEQERALHEGDCE